jgi:NAD(P)-dependent dehydrogenase (short-subunit alcohol dehydrogenase family)
MSLFSETSEALFDAFHRVLFKGPYFLTQTLLPMMADGGSIVNTSSNSSLEHGVEIGYTAYSSMKGAINVWTRVLAKELAPRRIRVNAVAPGATRTQIGGGVFDEHPEYIKPLAARTAFGRIGEPDDIGKVIAFLLSDDAGWITAQVLEVSGGMNL